MSIQPLLFEPRYPPGEEPSNSQGEDEDDLAPCVCATDFRWQKINYPTAKSFTPLFRVEPLFTSYFTFSWYVKLVIQYNKLPPMVLFKVHTVLKSLPFHGIATVHFSNLNNMIIDNFVTFLVNPCVRAIFRIMTRAITAPIP